MKQGKHQEPHVVMHEDDPAIKRYPTFLTRRNLGIAKSFTTAILIALIIWQQFELSNTQGDLSTYLKERRQAVFKANQQLACFIVRNHPDTDGEDYQDLRSKYKCPAYDPRKVRIPLPPVGGRSSSPKPSSSHRAIGQPGASRTSGVLPQRSRTIVATPSAVPTGRTVTATRTQPAPPPRTVTRRPSPSPSKSCVVNLLGVRVCTQ